MPEYLAPGVFVEETSFRSRSVEGVSTTTTGFIGPARYGPIDLESALVTSLSELERLHGNRRQLSFLEGSAAVQLHNYVWHAARAFFEEGGKRLYISRVFRNGDGTPYTGFDSSISIPSSGSPSYNDGHARGRLDPAANPASTTLLLYARYPGAAGNLRVRFTVRLSQNLLSFEGEDSQPRVRALTDRDVVLLSSTQPPPASGPFYLARWDEVARTWSFHPSSGEPLQLSSLSEDGGYELRVLTLTVSAAPADEPGEVLVWDGLALDAAHSRAGAPDSLLARFLHEPGDPARNHDIPLVLHPQDVGDGLAVLQALQRASVTASANPLLTAALLDPGSSEEQRSVEVLLQGGNDGARPTARDYEGREVPGTTRKTGLVQLEDAEDISILAAPGSTFGYESEAWRQEAATIHQLLISHCSRMKYRVAVLDSGNGQTLAQVRALRARLDSPYAALYYPWVKVMDPVTRQPIFLPPSGFVAGIYARNDATRAVHKAPANEVVNLALGFEFPLSHAQQEVLNPEGINAFRAFEGRGYRLWGARTVSSDPEWKYINVRRYFAYLERSIDKGTQWAVFEPNGPALWGNVRRTIEDFLLNEWQSGALLGERPEQAYFVRCDRSTMTQNDLDNGRLICVVGVAPLRPAEFVILRIGQWTGDRK
jgi:phage tail sheath protein FI